MSLSKYALGLFGSSHSEKFPLHFFQRQYFNFQIQPIHISSSPKNIAAILKENTTKKAIEYIQTNNIHLDYIMILIGGNDIGQGKLNPTEIADGIIKIANSFAEINIEPVIVPIFNRKRPRKISKEEYDSDRSKINRRLAAHYKKQHVRRIIILKNLHLKEDGVHLVDSSYRVLAKSIAFHIHDSIGKRDTKLPPGNYIDEKTGEEISVQIVYEEI